MQKKKKKSNVKSMIMRGTDNISLKYDIISLINIDAHIAIDQRLKTTFKVHFT